MNKTEDKSMKIGLNVFADRILAGDTGAEVTDEGSLIDFAVCHIEGHNKTVAESVELAQRLREHFEAQDTDFIVNFEFQNWHEDCTAPDGYSWSENENGCHRLKLPEEFVKGLAQSPRFKGIMYDELEHCIIHRNPTLQLSSRLKKIMPVFPPYKGRDVLGQGELLSSQLKDYASSFKQNGAPAVLGEHVYPVLFHQFARAGLYPNFKSLKENTSNIIFSIAAGAALQYNTPLYNCVDNWFRLSSPGHSPQEIYYNLLFAYYAGVDYAYVESISVMTDGKELTEYGKKFKQFCKEYKARHRDYSIRDYRPEIGIISYDTGYWGQWYPIIFKKCLLGNPKIKPDKRSREIFRIFNLLTHNESCKNGLSWCRISPWYLRHKHFSFASLNSTAVFDHNADSSVLDSLRLCLLCGVHISQDTLNAVRACVRDKGLTVVAPRRFVPQDILDRARGKSCEISDGLGKWIVIGRYDKGLKKYIKPFLGKKGEMRLTFAQREVVLKIGDDKDSFTVKE